MARRHRNRRRLRNSVGSAVVGGTVSAVLPIIVLAGGAFAVYFFYGASIKAWIESVLPKGFLQTPDQQPGGNDTSAATTLGALASNPGHEASVLVADVKDSAKGVWGLVTDEATSMENGVMSLWQKAKAAV